MQSDCPKENGVISDTDSLVGARYIGSGYEIPVYDDGFGPLWISRNSIGINGIVRAKTWEDAYSICEDEFFPEADETAEELIKEYGFKQEHVKIIHPATRKTAPVTFANGHIEAFDIDHSAERDATTADYELTGGKLLDGQFVRWETRETPDPTFETVMDNELFQEAYGFRNNGRNEKDKIGHGIYQKDLNGDSLDRLTLEMLSGMRIELVIESEDQDQT
jgi:hypothetical protein